MHDSLEGLEHLRYAGGVLHCDGVALPELADAHGTPAYVYSDAAIAARMAALRAAFGESAHVCYAVKSYSNLTVLQRLAELGCGFDLVSGGELARLRAAGVATSGAVFAGVAKEDWEIEAALDAGILFVNVESAHELAPLAAAAARRGEPARVAIRLNPDVDAGTHEYISTGRAVDKFGIPLVEAGAVVDAIAADPHLELVGYHVHLGSLIAEPGPFVAAFDRVAAWMDEAAVRSCGVRYYDLGGGFGVGTDRLDVAALAGELVPRLEARGLTAVLEPGRFLVAEAGLLLTRVIATKDRGGRRFVLVDAAMNDLIRPALYGAEHPIVPVRASGAQSRCVDVVGPVCESGDFLARDRELVPCQRGDLLAVLLAGAYGASMSSHYNSRRRAVELLVRGAGARVVRRRDRFEDLWLGESGARAAE